MSEYKIVEDDISVWLYAMIMWVMHTLVLLIYLSRSDENKNT